MRYIILILFPFSFILLPCQAQQSSKQIKSLIESYKNDPRGPYYRIKWFCEDGTIRDPKDPCPDDMEGIQHATFKESALKLRKSNHLYFSEILAGNDVDEFLDKEENYSRLKQYQINKYLATVDDGWVLRRAQYYRGAIQSEDEEEWGRDFFLDILKDDNFLESHYYLIRQALKDIPHNGDDNLAQMMRSQSKILSEEIPSFMDIRIKIHGQPEASDISLVKDYLDKNEGNISSDEKKKFEELLSTMNEFYQPLNFSDLRDRVEELSQENTTKTLLKDFLNSSDSSISSEQLVAELSNILYEIRLGISDFNRSSDRLLLLDLSNEFENKLVIETQKWETRTLADKLDKIKTLSCAASGTGLIEIWEYNQVETEFTEALTSNEMKLEELNQVLTTARSVVEWSASMVKANYQEDVDTYNDFEPLAYGFIDDRVRSSVALSLGENVSELGSFVAKVSNIENEVFDIDNQSSIRGLNPGYAYGELVVVDGNPDDYEVDSNKIYIFQKPPAGLKPVAGIMTVSEGNLVSHVQLLARNLGIPNAALSSDNMNAMKKLNGKKVFYAVSSKGNVIIKEDDDMNNDEKDLFNKEEKKRTKIDVPIDKIRLDVDRVLTMSEVGAEDSGKLCGPKAANLAQLKRTFPDHVVDGIIIPFGIFRTHMNKPMPNQNSSYWSYLLKIFEDADEMRKNGDSESEVEQFQLKRMKILYDAIIQMPLDNSFLSDIKNQFRKTFDTSIGNLPVFLRSDTNMEDLKEFTGAGLNLTLFNIRDQDKIYEGIKRVWASPYTDRSFKWRQKYLESPENVFPSILIIPGVDVDYSGVMITKGINRGSEEDLTVAFSRGAGGAVDGQSAETRLITSDANFLLAPARQPDLNRLPSSGGTKKYYTSFDDPILNEDNMESIRSMAKEIRSKMGKYTQSESNAYDVELGFKDDKLWLFQIRPFVENKQAKGSTYLSSIAPKVDEDKKIMLKEKV